MMQKVIRTGLWSIAIALAGGLFGGAFFVTSFLFAYSKFDGTAMLPVDCAIVFGTAVRPVVDEKGQIVYTGAGPGILRRMNTAAALYREGKVKKLFLTGGKGLGMPESESSVMQRMAVVRGVALEDITIEQKSTSTKENMANTLPLMKDCKSIVGVSDRYHLARIELVSRHFGRQIQTYPASPHANRAFEMRSLIRESLGIMLITLESLLT